MAARFLCIELSGCCVSVTAVVSSGNLANACLFSLCWCWFRRMYTSLVGMVIVEELCVDFTSCALFDVYPLDPERRECPFPLLVSFYFFRYSVDIQLDKQVVNKDSLRDPKGRKKARGEIKKKFEERLVAVSVPLLLVCKSVFCTCRHKTGKNRWFFQKLRF